MRGGLRVAGRASASGDSTKTFVGLRSPPSARRSWTRSRGRSRERAIARLSQGVAFFNSFRDLTASGFWSSKMGVEDLKYMGNVANPNWDGCPAEALAATRAQGA